MTLNRRSFLAYTSASAAGLGLAGLGAAEYVDRSRIDLLAQLIDGDPPDVDVRALGRAYLSGHPDERDRGRLLRLLGLDRRYWLLRRRRQAARIEEAIRQDIEADRFVMLDGWLFTRTEARLYALSLVR